MKNLELEKIVPDVGDGWKEQIKSMHNLDEMRDFKKQMLSSIQTCLEKMHSEIELFKLTKAVELVHVLDLGVQQIFYDINMCKLLEEQEDKVNEGKD